jgi:hypothetical protein
VQQQCTPGGDRFAKAQRSLKRSRTRPAIAELRRDDMSAPEQPHRPAFNWKIVAVVTLIATAIAWSLAAVQQPQYRASVMAAITPRPDRLAPAEMLRGVEVLERRTVVA